jgi:ribosomal protein L7Ae-like RNA K-turn-binding protein
MFPIFLAPRMFDEDFEILVREFLQELVLFQKRAYKKNPQKQKRRVVFGFRECRKALELENRGKMIIVARDVSIQTLIENEFNEIKKTQLPLIVGLTKRELGSIIGGRGEASIATIINAEGSYEKFHQIREKSLELKAKYLLNGIEIDHFWHICAFGHLRALNEMKKFKSEINLEYVNEGMTGLFACIRGLGELEMIKRLIEDWKCDYSLSDFNGNNILHLAVHRNELEIVKYCNSLLSRNLFWKKRNTQKRNVILEAISVKIPENIQVFADANFWNIEEQKEAVLAASKFSISSPLEVLINNCFEIPGESLVEAARHNSYNNVQLLLPIIHDKERIKEAFDWAKRLESDPMANFIFKHL